MEYKPTNYKKFEWLPLSVIQDAVKNNWTDSLCYLLWIKAAYKKKPIFYKHNLRKVAAKLDCSPTTAGYHIKILLDKGLLRVHCGNLCVVGRRSSTKIFKTIMVPVGIDNNKANQMAYIRFTLIKRNLHSQKTKHSEKSAVLKFRKGLIFDYSAIKRLKRISKTYPSTKQIENSEQNVFTLSNNKIGALCGRSQSTGIKIQKSFNNLGLIKSIKRLKRVRDIKINRKAFFSLELPSNYFLANTGYATKRLSNELVLLGNEM